MKKIYSIIFVVALALSMPIDAQAVIQSLNSQTGQNQTFTNDTNVSISSSGNTHTINWNGLLSPTRGGTGINLNTLPEGSILFNDSGTMSGKDTFWFDKDGSGDGRVFASFFAAATAFELLEGASIDFTSNSGNDLGGITMPASGRYAFFGPQPAILDTNSLTADRDFTFPNVSGTFGLLEVDQTWSGANTFSKGASATTTVNFGEIGDSTSHACFNTKNTDGNDISFYFVGTSMVVENNICQ
ncbi:hypothetical protein A2943_03515 [Candidatus Adlerbacteria bacterium RIFCSPLOWO2_01_FULL_51_16]|uniref:Uncharacterized protein n=1 Tax=Candidatus Adlerbacteria bacterium RIFCSPLOWO2_01_FULL_51_16 TaxID=1797243 RepID=A0A1F4XFY5_9BACT|nr:MAG: hypothetical protein A2943_03515 [Candidatus Adlerbacteria bacterium RIFCSPLOWO2_01_FULL_51_16]